MFLNCSTCFGRHAAHHQELKNCNCSLWFYIHFWLPATAMAQPSQWPATKNVYKTRGCNYSFLSSWWWVASPETHWAIKKHWNNKFYYTVASCWFILWDLYYEARIHVHQLSVPSSQVDSYEGILHTYPPTKMEQAECSETSAYKIRTQRITQKKAYKVKVWNQKVPIRQMKWVRKGR